MGAKNSKPSGLGLEALEGFGDLSSLAQENRKAEEGSWVSIRNDLIDPDPNQPRRDDNPGFSKESLNELAASIRERGVKSPISVRKNQDVPGRYIINHGERRYRANTIAGNKSIPAFIDDDYSEVDQVIENIQREELTPREIADYIGRRISRGVKKSAIAKEIGKSPAFITQHANLLSLPEPIEQVFNSGRAKDVTVINELITAYKKNSEAVEQWLLDEEQELTRGSVRILRDYLDEINNEVLRADAESLESSQSSEVSVSAIEPSASDEFYDNGTTANALEWELTEQSDDDGADELEVVKSTSPKEQSKNTAGNSRIKNAVVQVSYEGEVGRLMLDLRPSDNGVAWLEVGEGRLVEANLEKVILLAILEA